LLYQLSGVVDDNPAVRIAAVTGIGKLWLHSPGSVQEHGMIEELYSALRDMNSTVIVFTLQTLAFLLEKKGGIEMNRKMVSHFLSRIHTFPDQEFCCLAEYLPSSKSDIDCVLDILNVLDEYLESKNANVVLSTAKLFTELVYPLHSQLQSSLVRRLSPVLCHWIKQSKRDFQYDLLKFTLTLPPEFFMLFAKEKDLIKIKSKDGEQLKQKKIEFLLKLANTDICREIMNTLLNLLPSTQHLNSILVQGACDVSQLDVQVRQDCIKNLDLLVKSEPNRFLPVILGADLYLDPDIDKDNPVVKDLVITILQKINPDTCESSNLPCVLNIIQHFGHVSNNSPYLLEDLFIHHVTKSADTTADPPSAYLLSCFLSTAVSLFDIYPAVVQPILAEIMHKCSKMKDYQLHVQIQSYYKILQLKSNS